MVSTLVRVAPPSEVLSEVETDKPEIELDAETLRREQMEKLARYVNDCFDEAYRHRQKDIQRFINALYARRGEYTPDKLAAIREVGGSEEYARICAHKSRVLQAWLEDIFLANTEQPWTIEPTPLPSLPENVVESIKDQVSQRIAALTAQGQVVSPSDAERMLQDELDMERMRQRDLAEQRAEKMAQVIADQLNEGGFREALSTFISYLTTFPGAILKGPIFRKRDQLQWENIDGKFVPQVTSKIVIQFEAPNPMNCYPAPGATTPQEGYFIEHLTLTAKDLADLIGVDGYDEAAIRTILSRCNEQGGGYRWVERYYGAHNSAEDKRDAVKSQYIDVLEFHGPVSGEDLMDWGLDVDLDAQRYYEATVWLIDDIVIKATLNDDPLGRRPYYKACYEEIPGQFWGFSIYDVLSDVQGVANAAIRSLVNNMAIASGPQVAINVDRVPAGTDITNLHPWKIWQFVDGQFASSNGSPPVMFFQPHTNVQELLTVLERFYALADDFSFIPRYMTGSDKVSGPARTASGLSMLLDAANKGLKSIVNHIDTQVMTPLLQALFDHNMLYNEDESIKGDAQIVARGVASLMQLETLRMRRNEFLQITANPIDSQIVGIQGRASILREIAKGLGMDVNKVVPPTAVLGVQQAPQQALPQAPQQALPQAPQPSQEQLMDGRPVTDFMSPRRI